MTKADLQQKLEAFREQHRQAMANVHALAGAIQCCEQLIQEWEAAPVLAFPEVVNGDVSR